MDGWIMGLHDGSKSTWLNKECVLSGLETLISHDLTIPVEVKLPFRALCDVPITVSNRAKSLSLRSVSFFKKWIHLCLLCSQRVWNQFGFRNTNQLKNNLLQSVTEWVTVGSIRLWHSALSLFSCTVFLSFNHTLFKLRLICFMVSCT